MALTGGLAPNGRSALLAQKIWEEDTNAKGGLLGRPVKLIYYDDQTNPATVPGIYTKLLDVDKVDLIIGGYGTNLLAAAMPIAMQRKKVFIGLLGTAVNSDIQLSELLQHDSDWARPEAILHQGLLRPGGAAEPKAADGRDRGGRRGSRPVCSAKARAKMPRRPASPSSMTAGIQRQPPTSRRWCGRLRRRIRTSSSSAPIRPTRSAWCARSTRSASSRK